MFMRNLYNIVSSLRMTLFHQTNLANFLTQKDCLCVCDMLMQCVFIKCKCDPLIIAKVCLMCKKLCMLKKDFLFLVQFQSIQLIYSSSETFENKIGSN